MASASDAGHRPIIEGIIREGVKKHFRHNVSDELGELWQDYGNFCQTPDVAAGSEFHFCRRFSPAGKLLRDGLWAVEIVIDTSTLDGRTFADYYQGGNVKELAEFLAAKRANRLNRRNKPTAIRVWRDQSTQFQAQISVLELDDPDSLVAHGTLSRQEQRALAGRTVRCRPYKANPVDVPLHQIRLVLDTQITQEDHEETIIKPAQRQEVTESVRGFLHGADIYGRPLRLSDVPVDLNEFPQMLVRPPAVRLRDKQRGHIDIPAPREVSVQSLRRRSRQRAQQIRDHGFLQSRPIHPLLAAPREFRHGRLKRMRNDLNSMWRRRGIEYTFDEFLYNDVESLARHVESGDYNAVLAVLPESSRLGFRPDDTHDQIKERLEVVSQCIYHDNTLPPKWLGKKWSEFREAEPYLARRITQRYDLCLGNLLVKHHWVPFAPAEPFRYNVHVGIDVGGRHDTTAMVCAGHGFTGPDNDIVFRPEEIPIDVQKAEPIPTQCLLKGLRKGFNAIHSDLTAAGAAVDFNRVLFFRDGHFLGDGDAWNEIQALEQLHAEFRREKGWVNEDSVWTAVEILKYAEGWRVLDSDGQSVENPLVGRCVFPFDDNNMGLVCTTGRPYLPQGTARPLKIRILDIAGRAERSEVVRDLVWEADMCFSKPDMGMRLPWVLHVADTGALHKSRNYRINGIPV